jgi:hypothetical protein
MFGLVAVPPALLAQAAAGDDAVFPQNVRQWERDPQADLIAEKFDGLDPLSAIALLVRPFLSGAPKPRTQMPPWRVNLQQNTVSLTRECVYAH